MRTFKLKFVHVGEYFDHKGDSYMKVQIPVRMSSGTLIYALNINTGILTDKFSDNTDVQESILQR